MREHDPILQPQLSVGGRRPPAGGKARPLLNDSRLLIVDEAHRLPETARQMCACSVSTTDLTELCSLLEREHLPGSQALRGSVQELAHSLTEPGQRSTCTAFLLTAERKEALQSTISLLRRLLAERRTLPFSLHYRLEETEQLLSHFLSPGQALCPDTSLTPGRLLSTACRRSGHTCAAAPSPVGAGDPCGSDLRHPHDGRKLRADAPVAGDFLQVDGDKGSLSFSLSGELPALFSRESKAAPVWERRGSRLDRGADLISGDCGKRAHAGAVPSYSLMSTAAHCPQRKAVLFRSWRYGVNAQDIIRQFKQCENAVLFASGSCWEGVDFPGDMVSSLILPRLPFSAPDPLSEAEREQYPTLEDYIRDVVVPEMQRKLRQGFGRAIRTETDVCAVSILDRRACPGGRYHQAVLDCPA